jgi:signal transduction histidine kinase
MEYFENDEICSNCPAQKAREEAKSCRSTKIYQKKDKSKLILDIAAFPLQDEEGKISRVIVYTKDITDIINLEERVLFTERLTEVGELAAGVAHEIKNPLGNIVAAAQYCLLKQPLNEKSKNYLEIILRNAENANKIIKQLMTFAKPQELSFKVEDVTLSIDRVCSLVETKFAKQKVDIIKKWPKDIPPILLDSDMLEQAFLNLILNSLDAMPEGGRLIITAFVAGEQNEVVVSFVDSGKGISSENLEKVCEPFFTTKEAGLGLGLSFVRHAIDCHRGKMSIRSKVGQGTEITLRFPILR